jgi:hypothetical protein
MYVSNNKRNRGSKMKFYLTPLFSFLLFWTLSSSLAFAETEKSKESAAYKITKINGDFTRVIVSGPARTLDLGDELKIKNEFAESCRSKVIEVNNPTAVVDVSDCNFAKSLKVGDSFALMSATDSTPNLESGLKRVQNENPQEEKSFGPPTPDESWYTLWGIGLSGVRYRDNTVRDEIHAANHEKATSRTTTNLDLFGFYWPLSDRHSMQGFIINSIDDFISDTDSNSDFTFSQAQYSYSFLRFYGANIGDGWFWRGDAGFVSSREHVDLQTDKTYNGDTRTRNGYGALAGGGYAWPIGHDTRLLIGSYLTHRKMGGITANSYIGNVGFLF